MGEPDEERIADELLKKAKGFFGSNARKELLLLMDLDVRRHATEIAHRDVHPQSLYRAGKRGVLDALEAYEVGENKEPFRQFARPFIRQAMQMAKTHGPTP